MSKNEDWSWILCQIFMRRAALEKQGERILTALLISPFWAADPKWPMTYVFTNAEISYSPSSFSNSLIPLIPGSNPRLKAKISVLYLKFML